MAVQVRRITAVAPDPTKIGGVNFMVIINQATFDRTKVLAIEKNGNNFEMVYLHDTTDEGVTTYGGLRFQDENQDIPLGGSAQVVASKYVGKFDVGGVSKQVFLQV